MISQKIYSQEDAIKYPGEKIGGKAFNLARLTLDGFPVPKWYVISTDYVEELLDAADLTDWINAQVGGLSSDASQKQYEAVSVGIQEKILKLQLSDDFKKELVELIGLSHIESDFFAVRSSVVGEDAEGASFAGQMDSYLFQKGLRDILKSILKVIASAFNHRALLYRVQKGLSVTNIRAAVIIQEMIKGDVSGVLFTANPVTGSRKHSLISGTYGCGEGVVSGLCAADEFTVNNESNEIESVINTKDTALVFDYERNFGALEIDVDPEKREIPCLSSKEVVALKDLGCQIALAYQFPQDIEWTIAEGKLYILQTRPVTQLPPPQNPKDNLVVWDNSNIQESYCGVTTPLTFSFASKAYGTVYEQSSRIFGISERSIRKDKNVLENLLGLINGRVYYNINNWYRGLLNLPSFSTNKEDMERMMGLEDPVDLVQAPDLGFKDKLYKLPQMFRSLALLLFSFFRMDKLVADFRSMFEEEYSKIPRSSLHTLTYSELIALCRQLDVNLQDRWTTPIINDFYVMMMNGKVHRWLEKSGVENAASLQNNLMSGEEGIESTEPTKMLLRMCEEIRVNPGLLSLFKSTDNENLMHLIKANYREFYAKCQEYIERYGDRVMGELKLESITLRQDPSFLFAVLKNYLLKPDLTIETLHDNELKLRQEAETVIFDSIKVRLGNKSLIRFKKDLKKLRSAVKNRENMRLARTRSFGLYRDIFLEIGAQLAFYGVISNPRDIFYLTVDELYAYNDGRSVQKNLKPLISARKEEFEEYKGEELPHHFWTWGAVYHHNEYEYPFKEKEQLIDENADILKGTGCYPGVVEKPIRLIFSPDDELNLDGQILCTVRTDPGWAPLFPTAGGIIVERGSTLSHSAVVARELGIPAIVGVPGLTKILKDKEMIRMDGATGVIERIGPTNATAVEEPAKAS